jgi:2-dehydropantoate 2-reductase
MKTPLQTGHVVIIGPGAIGSCLAVRLALAEGGPLGCARGRPRITLIDYRPDRAARLSARPIRIHTPDHAGRMAGDLEARIPVRLRPEMPPDLVILAVKAHVARAAAASAASWIGRAPILAIQNGLGVAEEVARALPETTVITAVSYQAATLLAEGDVRHVANLPTHLGYEGRPPDAAARAVADLLNRAGLPAAVEPDMTPIVWTKLLINAALNPTAALAGVANGEVAVRPTLRAMARAIAEEGAAVARAARITLPYEDVAEAVFRTARQSADNRCSMLQDLDAGKPTEIDVLNGALVRIAEAHGAAVPVNRAVTALVKAVHKRP